MRRGRHGAPLLSCMAALAMALGCSRADRPGFLAGGSVPVPDPGDAAAAVPCTEGATIPCGVELGSHDGIVDCAKGLRTCAGGSFGPCTLDASKGTASVPAPPPKSGAAGALGALAVGGTASQCKDDPCNPYCMAFDDVPDAAVGASYDAATLDVWTGGSLASSNVPPGFQNKGTLDDQCATPCAAPSCLEACQFDQHCVGVACQAYAATESDGCAGLDAGSAIDITVPTTCTTKIAGTDYRVLSVCNRGSAAAPPGVQCFVYPGNSPQFPNANPGPGTLVMTTTTTIAPGSCESQSIPESTFPSSGTRSLACNVPGTTPPPVAECNPYDNWSVTKANPATACERMTSRSYAPFTVTRLFVGACPAGAVPVWRRFGWDATTPGGTRIEFRFRASPAGASGCTALPAATSDPPTPIAIASTTHDPASCPIVSDGGICPKDLHASLGLPEATYACLQMDAYGVPSATSAPTLLDWTVTYDCVPSE